MQRPRDEARNGGINGLCYSDNRAIVHLHGGITPWISDGTPHQWITPANENTPFPEGVSVQNVPDMNQDVVDDPTDGVQTFYYTNAQSARLMFYHDHSWGITRLNVYAGDGRAVHHPGRDRAGPRRRRDHPGPLTPPIPLVFQDKTFVPNDAQLALQDETWDTAALGRRGQPLAAARLLPGAEPR